MIGYQFSSFSNDHQDDMPYWTLRIPPTQMILQFACVASSGEMDATVFPVHTTFVAHLKEEERKWLIHSPHNDYSVPTPQLLVPFCSILLNPMQRPWNSLHRHGAIESRYTTVIFLQILSQIPQCIRQISHNSTLWNRNVHMCADGINTGKWIRHCRDIDLK